MQPAYLHGLPGRRAPAGVHSGADFPFGRRGDGAGNERAGGGRGARPRMVSPEQRRRGDPRAPAGLVSGSGARARAKAAVASQPGGRTA